MADAGQWKATMPTLSLGKHQALISPGIAQPLDSIPFHADGPLRRRLLAGQGLHPDANWHVAVHELRAVARQSDRDYCVPHAHTCDELNLLLSFGRLVMRVDLEEESYVVQAPASIFIPAGLLHSANVIEGSGFFVALLPQGNYAQTLATEDDTHPTVTPIRRIA
jgi:hypothetical protein